MRKLFSILTLCLLLATPLEAGKGSLQVTLRGRRGIETEPKRTITFVYMVANKTAEKRQFETEIKLPEAWRVVTRDSSFELEADESGIRLVSFFIPQATLAGSYQINYSVKEIEHPSFGYLDTLQVVVLPVSKLELKLLEAPEYVIAGEDYRASFVVTNASNIENRVSIRIDSEENLPFAADTADLKLAPGESKKVTVTVKTDPKTKKVLRHRLKLTAQVFQDESVRAQAMSFVQITPRVTGVQERFHTIPARLSFRQLIQKNEAYKFGFQPEISGAGTLDEEGKRQVNFFYRGPDIQDNSIFRQHDQYRFSFWTKRYELHLGDRAYSLSPLTENRYGRGMEAKLNLGDFSLGAYHQKSRWIEPQEERIAARLDYSISEKYKIGLNYFSERSENVNDRIVSLHGQLQGIKDTDLELEYAYGKKNEEDIGGDDNAYLLGLRGHHGLISYTLRFIHAGPDYPGYYADMDFFAVGLAAPLGAKLRLNADFQQGKNNLDLDTNRYSAPLEKHYRLGLDYRFETGTNLSFEYRNPIREDRLLPPEFSYEEKTCRLTVGHGFRKVTLRSSLELGRSRNNLTGSSSNLERYSLSTYFRPNSKQSYTGYIAHCNSFDFSGKKRGHITARLESSLKVSNRTYLTLKFQAYDYQESYLGDRDDFEISLTHSFRNQSRISVSGRRSSHKNSEGGVSSALTVEYALPFGVPVGRKKSVGTVKGEVSDGQTKTAIPDVILTLNGATAVTNKSGKFIFPSLEPGTYHLDINTVRVGMNRIAAQSTPIEVTVEEGKETSLKIGITESAALFGQILLYRQEKENDADSPVGENGSNHAGYCVVGEGGGNGISPTDEAAKLLKAAGLANVLVELSGRSELKRRVTDAKGCFGFEELRPGRWTLKIYEQGLPEYHYLEQDRFEFELEPGQKKELLVRVLLQKRRIRILKDGGNIQQEEQK